MNEFTKEELQELFDILTWMIEDYREPDIIYKIRDKVKSMLSNYSDLNMQEYETMICVSHHEEIKRVLSCTKCKGLTDGYNMFGFKKDCQHYYQEYTPTINKTELLNWLKIETEKNEIKMEKCSGLGEGYWQGKFVAYLEITTKLMELEK